MSDYNKLLKDIALNNEQDDIYRLLDIFLEFTDDFIKPHRDKGVLEEDLKQECALVMSEMLLDGSFIEKSNRRERLITGEAGSEDEVFREIIRDISTGCEEALVVLTGAEAESKKISAEVLAKVNLINEGVIRFCEEYGMKPTPKELSDYLAIDEEVIIEAVELSGYEIKDIDFDTPVSGKKT